MYPFTRKPSPIYQAPANFDQKALDTSAAERNAAHNMTAMLPIMPDPQVQWIDALRFQEIEAAIAECPVAQRCVDIRADKLSSVAVTVQGGPQTAFLMDSPNARHKTLSQNVFIWANDLTIAGEANLMLDLDITGRPQLFRARPDLLETDYINRIVTYDDGRLTGKKNPKYRFFFDEAWDCIGCEERKGSQWLSYPAFLIRIRHHNPASDQYGKGSCKSVLKSVRAWLDLQDLLAKNIKRGGPKHAATLRGTVGLSDAEYETLAHRINSAARVSANSMAVIPEATLVATGSNFSELSIDTVKETLERDIATGLAVQPVLLGMRDENDYAALRGAERIFYNTWVKPEAEWLFAELQAHLRQYLKEPNAVIAIDEAHLTFTQDENMERAKVMKDLAVFSINEIRSVMGAGPVPGGEAVAGASATAQPDTALASREVDRALGTQSPAEREVDAALKPREVAITADTSMRRSEKRIQTK